MLGKPPLMGFNGGLIGPHEWAVGWVGLWAHLWALRNTKPQASPMNALGTSLSIYPLVKKKKKNQNGKKRGDKRESGRR